jgi:hypothetical protein
VSSGGRLALLSLLTRRQLNDIWAGYSWSGLDAPSRPQVTADHTVATSSGSQLAAGDVAAGGSVDTQGTAAAVDASPHNCSGLPIQKHSKQRGENPNGRLWLDHSAAPPHWKPLHYAMARAFAPLSVLAHLDAPQAVSRDLRTAEPLIMVGEMRPVRCACGAWGLLLAVCVSWAAPSDTCWQDKMDSML